MKLIIPIYILAIGNFLVGVFDLWLALAVHNPATMVYGAIFNAIGLTSALIAIVLRDQNRRIEKLELLDGRRDSAT